MDYTLGLDIGITSVGACAIDQENAKLIELSVRKFDEAKEAKEARLNRSARRTLRRKKWRKEQLLSAFNDFGVIPQSEIDSVGRNNYLNYYGKGPNLTVPEDYTVYHLRKRALTEKISKREMLLCLYNILQARGHFLLDTIDFSRGNINYEFFREKFYGLTEPIIEFSSDRKGFEDKILKKLFASERITSKDFKKLFADNRFTVDEENDKDLQDICSIIYGWKAPISRFYNLPDEKNTNIESLKRMDVLNEFQSSLVELYDICRIARVLKDGNNYVCDIAVKEIDKYKDYKNGRFNDKETIDAWNAASKSKNHTRAYKNLNNSFPNGLYVKEVSDMLHFQQQFYSEITDAFIEVCCSIVSARIPYYVGPLGTYAKNGWAKKEGKIKYSYNYSAKDMIDVENTIREWKKKHGIPLYISSGGDCSAKGLFDR